MKYGVTLGEWLSKHNINRTNDLKELENIFYKLDLKMKYLHTNNYYIIDFNVNHIYIDDDMPFSGVIKMDDDKNSYIEQNIYYLACLELAIYSDCLNYINPANKEYFRDNFNDFISLLPEEVSSYYNGVFVKELYIYLSDFIKMKNERESGFNNSLVDDSNNNSSNSKGVSITKSTLVGRLMSENESNMSAFIRIVLFPVIILFLSILIPIMAILIYK